MTAVTSGDFKGVFGNRRGLSASDHLQLDAAAALIPLDEHRQAVVDAFLAGGNSLAQMTAKVGMYSIRMPVRRFTRSGSFAVAFALLIDNEKRLLAFTPQMAGAEPLGAGTPVYRLAELDGQMLCALGDPECQTLEFVANNSLLRSAVVSADCGHEREQLLDRVTLTAEESSYLGAVASFGSKARVSVADPLLLGLPLSERARAQEALVDKGLIDTTTYPAIAISRVGWLVHDRLFP